MAHLRACSAMERVERLKCLEMLSRSIAPAARPAGGSDNWLVSETTSPVDYSPIVAATTCLPAAPDSSTMQLSDSLPRWPHRTRGRRTGGLAQRRGIRRILSH